jgi:hypothetical protein
MLYTLKVKLDSPILGNLEDGSGVKRFGKTADGEFIHFSNDIFKWAVEESLSLLRLDNVISSEYFVEVLPVRRPTLVLYNRKYKDKISEKFKVSSHEAVRAGATITLDILVLAKLPKTFNNANLRAPSTKEIKTVIATIGKFFGISPWGSHTGKFGRFELIEFNEKETI